MNKRTTNWHGFCIYFQFGGSPFGRRKEVENMQFCPRCRTYKEAWLFQAPVSICMACYGSSQGNEGLSLIQLKQKAIKSYKANRRKNLERRDIMIQSWTPYKDLMPKAGFSPSHK